MPSGKVICVLGMHRSGTSVIARMLDLLGAHLGDGDRLLPPAPDNPKGFWEHRELVAINDELLARFDGTWVHPPTLPDRWETSPRIQDLRDRALDVIDSEFDGKPVWAWKDPRTCLTLAFWQAILPSMQYVICVRNPLAVARSLHRRQAFSIQKSSTLWAIYTASAFRQTSGRPRLTTFFEDLMLDPKGEVSRLAKFIGAPDHCLARALEASQEFLDESLYRHRPQIAQSVQDPDVAFPAKALYVALRSRYARRQDSGLQAELDDAIDLLSVETHQQQSLEPQDDVQSDSQAERSRLEAAVRALQDRLARSTAEREHLQAEIWAAESRIADLDTVRAQTAVDLQRARNEWGLLQHQLNEEISSLSEIVRQREHTARHLGRQIESLTAMPRSRLGSWLSTTAATLDALGNGWSPGTLAGLVMSFARHPGRLRDAFAITESGVFDEGYYRTSNADLAQERLSPLAHFVLKGAFEGRSPHPLFDSAGYRKMYLDIPRGANPFVHYLRFGAREGRTPHLLFDVPFYTRSVGRPLLEDNALIDYIRRGALENVSPHPLFDPNFYERRNPDVLSSGLDPICHFLLVGAAKNRDPHRFFDCSGYLANNPDVRASGVNPLVHYVERGWREGRRPCASFDPAFYASRHEDVRNSGCNPLVHYVVVGRREGRIATPDQEPSRPQVVGAPAPIEAR